MVKKVTAIALIILTLFMGVSGTNAQVIRPILSAPNDNLLINSGWWNGLEGYQITGGTLDTEHKFDGCNSIRQIENDKDINIKLDNIVPHPTKSLYFSCKIKSDMPNIFITVGTASKVYYDNGTYEIMGASKMLQIDSDEYLYTSDLSYIDKKVIKIDLNINIGGNNCLINIYQPKLEYGSSPTPYCPSIYDNVKWDYDQYGASFQSQKVGDIQNITEYQYKKSLTDVGLFSMTIPLDTPYADEIAEDYYLFVDKKDWLLVQDVKKTETGYYITGTDLKGILATRITLYDVVNDTMGFDSVNGSTETCCKHYVLNNVVNPADTNRIIPLVTLATDQYRGIANDTYMSRLEPLHEVIKKLCENAEIGYDVYADVMNNKIIFDIIDITDKSIDQQERNRIIFSVESGNIISFERVKGNSTFKNAFYATKSGGNLESDATTKLCLRGGTVPKGIARKEMHLNVSCESVADIETYAKYQYKDYAKINSIDISPADVQNYGVLYDIGDKVTLKIGDEYVNKIIRTAEKTYNGNSYSVTIGFGDKQPQPLKYLKTMINNKGV